MWWRAGLLALMWVGVTLAIIFTGDGEISWWWIGCMDALGLLALAGTADQTLARTLLTSEGMRFHTFFSRRTVLWTEIVRIEEHSRTARNGTWWTVKAVRYRGRALTVPGVITNKYKDPHFEQKLATIRAYWSHAHAD